MAPTPCKHCGMNFMPADSSEIDYELCHNCKIREQTRTPKIEKKMATISILVTLPSEIHRAIEENCLAKNTDFNQYFLELYQHGNSAISQKEDEICVKPAIKLVEPGFIKDIDTYVAPAPTQVFTPKTKLKNKSKK